MTRFEGLWTMALLGAMFTGVLAVYNWANKRCEGSYGKGAEVVIRSNYQAACTKEVLVFPPVIK